MMTVRDHILGNLPFRIRPTSTTTTTAIISATGCSIRASSVQSTDQEYNVPDGRGFRGLSSGLRSQSAANLRPVDLAAGGRCLSEERSAVLETTVS